MKLDIGTLSFGNKLQKGGQPNWATSLGQGKGYKIKDNIEGIDDILKGLVYSGVRDEGISYIAGKGGKEGEQKDLRLCAVFSNIKIEACYLTLEGELEYKTFSVKDRKYILIVTVDTSESHRGRLRLKYSPKIEYTEEGKSYSNQDVYKYIESYLHIKDGGCWFVSHIDVRNQDTIILKVFIVDKESSKFYQSSEEMRKEWEQLIIMASERKAEVAKGENVILFGMPGCGKSHAIKEQYCDDEQFMERVVFHPDYTYSDFIGQILPQLVDGHISYSFVPGPFTRILKEAQHDPYNKYYLIIEEINRGNASAIFGDVFQLLDRENGASEYGISNAEIANAVYENPEALVKIPANLSIIATMNTVDQNVFTLDTAFKRRWRMKSVTSDIENCPYAGKKIAKTDITWKQFVNTFNELIINSSNGYIGAEDKRFGAYFVQNNELENLEQFSSKVLLYLWNDVFKHDREIVFKREYKTLDHLITDFCSSDEPTDVFSEQVQKGFKKNEKPSDIQDV